MNVAERSLAVSVELEPKDIAWSNVARILASPRFGLPSKKIKKLLRRFIARITTPLEPYWARTKRLNIDDNLVVTAIAELKGADKIVLTHESRLGPKAAQVGYRQRLTFAPEPRRAKKGEPGGEVETKYEIDLFGLKFCPSSSTQIGWCRLAVMLSLASLYSVAFGLALYCLAIGFVFQELPLDLTVAAVTSPAIGLGLIVALVLITTIISRLAAHIGHFVLRLFKRQS